MHTSSSPFVGIVPPVVTPLLPTGAIDWDSLDRLVETLITAGHHGLFVMGSTGEVAYMTNTQRAQIIERVAQVNNGRLPIIAGAIDLTAQRCIEQARIAQDCGADAVVVTAPIYAINDVAETKRHFRTIAAGIGVPLFAYDIPARVHTKLAPDMLVELGKEGVLTGVKDSSGDDVTCRRLIAKNNAAGHPLQVLTGHEVVVDAMLLAGADGVVPGLGNVDPVGYTRLWEAAKAGDWEQARYEQERLNELFEIVFVAQGRSGDAAGVGAFKCAMHAQGLIAHPTMAHPVETLDGDVATRIRAITAAHNQGPA